MVTTPTTTQLPTDIQRGWIVPALGIGAGVLAAAFISIHWTLIIIGGLTVFFLSMFEWEPFFLLIIFLLPVSWRLQSDLPVKDVQAAIHLLVVMGYFFGRFLRGQFRAAEFWHDSLGRASLLFLGAVLVSAQFGSEGWTHLSLRAIFFLLSFIGFYFVISSWIQSAQRLGRALIALLMSMAFQGAFAIYQQVAGGYSSLWLFLNPLDENSAPWNGRSPSFAGYSNSFGGYLVLVLPLAIACFALGNQKWRKLGGWSLGLGLAGLALSQSRGAIVAFGFVAVLAVGFYVRSWPKRFLLVGSLAAIAGVIYLAARIWNPEHFAQLDDYSAATRVLLWSLAARMFAASPIVGVGFGNFQGMYGDYLKNISWIPAMVFGTHNIYLQMLSETGLLGFTAFFFLLIRAIKEAIRQIRVSRGFLAQVLGFGVIGAILALLVHGCVDYTLGFAEVGTLFWMLLALLTVNGRLLTTAATSPVRQPAALASGRGATLEADL